VTTSPFQTARNYPCIEFPIVYVGPSKSQCQLLMHIESWRPLDRYGAPYPSPLADKRAYGWVSL
jgi:hypothetical protein